MSTNIHITTLPTKRNHINFLWDWNNVGYGELTIDIFSGKVEVWNENLSREEVRELLISYVDHIIKHGEFKEFRED